MACGENPRSKSDAKIMPESRMGEAWLFRQRFEVARELMFAQNDWCESAKGLADVYGSSAHMHAANRYPERLVDETLVALLRGQVILNVHCYETYDLEMLVKLMKEFKFQISTFHHGLEAWRVPQLLKDHQISAAIFADHW